MKSPRMLVEREFLIGNIDPRVSGSFVEHLGRTVYGGLYERSHPSANEDGFRQDVLALVRELNVSTVRYPGGQLCVGLRMEGYCRSPRAT